MKSVSLIAYQQGFPQEENFSIIESEKPALSDEGTILVKVLYVSVDPYMRGRMRSSGSGYVPPYPLGKPISGFLVGEVEESKNSNFPVGTLITCVGEYSEFIVLNEKAPLLAKLTVDKSEVSHGLGVIGMPGLTAYFGFFDICLPKQGETVVVSGAAGAVGGYVVQLAKHSGCRVIGIAGSEEKTKFLREEYGCDEVINYKTDNVLEKLKEYAPNGVDIYFDNVGGEITDHVFSVLNVRARVSACGSISSYNKDQDIGPRQWSNVVSKGLKIQGFIVSRDYGHRWAEGVREMTKLWTEKKVKGTETIREGIENVPKAFIELFTGGNIGKLVIKV